MKLTIPKLSVVLMTICLLATAANAQSINVTVKDGSRWRGQVNDTVTMTISERGIEQTLEGQIVRAGKNFLTIEALISGAKRQKTVFFGDIVSIKSASDPTPKADVPATKTTAPTTETNNAASKADTSTASPDVTATKDSKGRPLGVFFLPMQGEVGMEMRKEEIIEIGKEADKAGPGQIIVLQINTNGGLVSEMLEIEETIRDIQKRHRVVAWVKKAISAGCATAMCCPEIYFMTDGSAGSVTTVMGTTSMNEDQAESHVEALVETARRNGYSEHIARAMKLNKYMCSYDKDPVTGDVTFYGDLSGKYILSDDKSNLCFNSSNALDCGFSKGTADTTDDLAKKLNLPEWKEFGDGREMEAKWVATCDRASEQIPLLFTRRQYAGTSGSAVERIGKLIRIDEELLRWCDRAPNIAMYKYNLDKASIQRDMENLRKQLADMQRDARRGG